MRKQGVKISDAVSEAMKAMDDSDFMRTVNLHLLTSLNHAHSCVDV